MPYCMNCGTQLPEQAKFCARCGSTLNAESGARMRDVVAAKRDQPVGWKRHR